MELHHKYHRQKMVTRRPRQWGKFVFFMVVFACAVYALWRIVIGIHGLFVREDNEMMQAEEIVEAPIQDEEIVEEDPYTEHIVADGDIPAEVFSQYGHFDANDTAALIAAAEEVFDFTHIKIGQPLRFYFDDGDERAMRMEYDHNTEQVVVVERTGDDFVVHEDDIAYDVTESIARGTIENFFYVDALDAGLSEPTVLEVGDIFSFSVDFTTDIRVGDEFDFVYETRTRDGKEAPDGRILAAKFVNDGTAHYAYYFDNDGEGGYYDGDGHALERQFLKAPLSYSRITSGYTAARYHPITKTVTAHYQIDYAAPVGTPVVASARGTVTSAGWETGWGNIVRMSHDNGYTTHYGHLSAFADGIVAGMKVAQGTVIGYVGSTGWSTGPHLDYGMKLNGSPVNPLTLVQPKGEPLPDEKMDEFNAMKERFASILEQE